jgi:2-amino-4-hydroxy-6-hydroxymethyldihydropteridine diphosphokinase
LLDEIGVIALGSNLPGVFASSEDLLEAAVASLPDAGFDVVAVSRWWRGPAWPDPSEPDYLNGVVLVETAWEPSTAVATLLEVEQAFGRVRDRPNAPRTLDLDLIALGRLIVDRPDLVLPHPRAHLRRFVMGPLAELAPDWIHPSIGRTARDLAAGATIGLEARPQD